MKAHHFFKRHIMPGLDGHCIALGTWPRQFTPYSTGRPKCHCSRLLDFHVHPVPSCRQISAELIPKQLGREKAASMQRRNIVLGNWPLASQTNMARSSSNCDAVRQPLWFVTENSQERDSQIGITCLSLPKRVKVNNQGTVTKRPGPGCPQNSNFDGTRRFLGSHMATRDINLRSQRVEDEIHV